MDETFDGLLGDLDIMKAYDRIQRKARIMLYLAMGLSFLVGVAVGIYYTG